MTKICFISNTHWSHSIGGSELQLKKIIDYLIDKKSYDIYYLCKNSKLSSYRSMKIIQFQTDIIGDFLEKDSFHEVVKRISPDFIYFRNGSRFSYVLYSYLKKNPLKLLYHISHNDETNAARIDFGTKKTSFFRSSTFSLSVIKLLRAYFHFKLLNLADKIICQTYEQKQNLYENHGLLTEDVIYNVHEKYLDKSSKSSFFTVIFVANVRPFKQYDIFLNIVSFFKENKNIRFLHIGRLPKKYENVQDSCNNLITKGELEPEKTIEYISKSHLLLNTSTEEGFPNTFIQAWYSGVPVVTLSVDPDNLIKHHNLGFVGGNVQRTNRIIQHVSEKEKLLKMMGVKCRTFAEDKFSTRNLELLDSIIE